MAEPSDAEVTGPVSPGIETAVYIDASALAKLYVPEAESERLDTFRHGRLGLMISELAITEVLSAVARRARGRVASRTGQPDPWCAARRCRLWFVRSVAFGSCGASRRGTPSPGHGLAAFACPGCATHRTSVLGESNSRPDLRPTDARSGRSSRHERE